MSAKPDDDSKYPYELAIVLKKGTVRGGGLSNSSHVVTSVDGVEIDKSADSPSPPSWNRTIIKKLAEVQRVDPIILGFSMYKKRWTAPGYKLVGSTQFPLSELLPHLNKDPIEKEIQLNTNRLNLTLSGTLSLSLQLKEVTVAKCDDSENHPAEEEPFSWAQFGQKWKTIITTSKHPVNAVIVNTIHDLSTFFQFIGKFENPCLGSVVKVGLIVLLGVFLFQIFFQSRTISASLNTIDEDFDSMIAKMRSIVPTVEAAD
eukprot:gene3643-3893_t